MLFDFWKPSFEQAPQSHSTMEPLSRHMQPGRWEHRKFCFWAAVRTLQRFCSLDRAWNSSGPTRPSYFQLQAKLLIGHYPPAFPITICIFQWWTFKHVASEDADKPRATRIWEEMSLNVPPLSARLKRSAWAAPTYSTLNGLYFVQTGSKILGPFAQLCCHQFQSIGL